MPLYTLAEISRLVKGKLFGPGNVSVAHLVYDSRRIQHPESSLFFALHTSHGDGHRFIADAHKKGIRALVVQQPVDLPEVSQIVVADVLEALQAVAAFHRQQFGLPVIGITGSNGKTVVKEWLNQLLEADHQIVRSPKSYNSQIGVCLSVWQMEGHHTLGIFEAGISQPGEMQKLQRIIRPTLGIITNLGEAHSEGFASPQQKLQEKLKLFEEAETVIGPAELLSGCRDNTFTWSFSAAATLQVQNVLATPTGCTIQSLYSGKACTLDIPFSDEASIQNAITCWCVMLKLGYKQEQIQPRFKQLHPVDMRLQLHHGINQCLIVNDSYSADTTSLKIGLDFLLQQSAGRSGTVILSDFVESGKNAETLYGEIAELLNHYNIRKLVAVGSVIGHQLHGKVSSNTRLQTFSSTEEFLERFKSSDYHNEAILIKGARRAGFERIALLFEQKLHGTVLQINLTALTHNLKAYQKSLQPTTKLMAMVKAFSYGSGGAEIASVLQFNNVAYLGVAYADEGVDLVKAGIAMPIMVMNAEEASFAAIVEHNLQPVIYSEALLQRFESYIRQQGIAGYPVHLEIETGMNRLGFSMAHLEKVASHFASQPFLRIQSVFSHLAASEEAANDDFTALQATRFNEAVAVIKQYVNYSFLQHISNSAAIVRHPHLQMDMVRLGIGLYGVEPGAGEKLDLQSVATLHSTVAQIKTVKAGESVSYNRKGVVLRDSKIATVRIGYADGYSRRFGYGTGNMLVRGKLAPVVGTVCMDMTMIDVTDIAGVAEGDDVIIFGPALPVQEVAGWIQTIPYEIMTSVSQRVKRVYYYE
jgi:alanine racemase